MPFMSLNNLRMLASYRGLSLIGALPMSVAEEVLQKQSKRLAKWQSSGFSGEMSYMQKPSFELTSVSRLLPECQSVVCFVVSYCRHELQAAPAPHGFGRVARYAWGRDYHRVLKKRLRLLVGDVERELGRAVGYRLFSDAVPLLERALAVESTDGFVGRNSMFIQPGVGSFTFLAEVLWNVRVEGGEQSGRASKGSCGSCRRCRVACPTQAIVSDGVIDARRCISYLTIEKRTEFTDWERVAIGDWLFGCDICQDVCPFNHEHIEESVFDEFHPASGVGSHLALIDLLSITTHQEFTAHFAGTPIMRTGRDGLLRNACCVAANTGFTDAIPRLKQLAEADSSAMVQEHARWAVKVLGGS